MKKLLGLLLAFAVCLSILPVAHAEAFDDSGVKTKYIMLMEAGSGCALYEKAADERAFPASTTKIMTCILALEKGNLDDTVTVPSVTSSGSQMGLRKGETLSLRSLIYGMMLVSGNDAAEAVAIHVGGSKQSFVDMMNEKAKELGMKNTHFMEPSGLHKEEHYSTARDMAVLTRYALMESPKKDDFRAIVKKGSYEVKDSSREYAPLENTNKLIHTTEKNRAKGVMLEYRNAIGVKTGDTKYAMRCLVAAAEKDGITLISVQLYDEEEDYRFKLATRLFDWGFENFKTQDAASLGFPSTVDIQVKNCSFDDPVGKNGGLLALDIDLSGKVLSQNKEKLDEIAGNISAVTTKIIPVGGDVVAPLKKGDLVATIAYSYNGEELFVANAYASADVAGMSGVANSPEAPKLEAPIRNSEKQSAGPWLFLILVLVCILFAAGLILYIRNRNRRRKRSRRRIYSYRGRR